MSGHPHARREQAPSSRGNGQAFWDSGETRSQPVYNRHENGEQDSDEILTPDGKKVLLDQPAACDAIKWWYNLTKEGYPPDGATITASDPAELLDEHDGVLFPHAGRPSEGYSSNPRVVAR